jgi:hypothetical protein
MHEEFTMKKTRSVIISLLIASIIIVGVSAANFVQYRARLLGVNEVPAVVTDAYGSVRIRHVTGDSELDYKIDLHRANGVVAAHIHCAPAGTNGPVGVLLFAGGPVDVDGLLVSGTITAPDPGNSCGWVTVDDIVSAVLSGNAYVNIHTTSHPSGELRGQLFLSP